jgi:hypothetical protein
MAFTASVIETHSNTLVSCNCQLTLVTIAGRLGPDELRKCLCMHQLFSYKFIQPQTIDSLGQ